MDESSQAIKVAIENRFTDSGCREKLKEMLKQRLLDSGWADHLKVRCRGMKIVLSCIHSFRNDNNYYLIEMIQQKNGVSQVSVESLVQDLTPMAKGNNVISSINLLISDSAVSVPEAIKNEIFQEIQSFLQDELEKYASNSNDLEHS